MLSSSQKIKQFKSELETAKKLNTITLYHNMYATPPTKKKKKKNIIMTLYILNSSFIVFQDITRKRQETFLIIPS